MTDDARRGAYLFDAYFQERADPNADWESVVVQFKKSESLVVVQATHDALARLLASSTDRELVSALFGPVPLSSYKPQPKYLTTRAWVAEIIRILGGATPRNFDSTTGARLQAVSIARAVLAGKIDVLVGARDLRALRFSVGLAHDDPDFMCFVAIESETDTLPLSDERSQWSADALLRLDPEVARAIEWATEFGWEAFENVVRRFKTAG